MSSASYAVFAFVPANHARETPVGVALWSAGTAFVDVRFVTGNERPAKLDANAMAMIDVVREQVLQWIAAKKLPQTSKEVDPSTTEWWREVQKLLVQRVRISQAMPIEVADLTTGIDSLFDAIVQIPGPGFRREAHDSIVGALDKF